MECYPPSLPFQQLNGRVIPFGSDGSHIYSFPTHLSPPYSITQAPAIIEAKPRLGKDEVNKLEREFEKNQKPSTQTKKGFAEEMNVDLPRINNWFQNRRAKRKQEMKGKKEADQVPETMNYPTPNSPDMLSHERDQHNNDYQSVIEPIDHTTHKLPSKFIYSSEMMEPISTTMESFSQSTSPIRNNSPINYDTLFFFNNTNYNSSLPLDTGYPKTATQLPSNTKPKSNNLDNQIPAVTSPLPVFSFKNINIHVPDAIAHTHLMRSDKISPLSPNNCFGQSNKDYIEKTPQHNTIPVENLHDEIYSKVKNFEAPSYGQENFSSPPAPNNTRFISRPPVNIALRRKKVQHRPAALTAHTLINPHITGPCSTSHLDRTHLSLKSPLDLSMRRIVSAGGNRAVVSGRVQKHSFDVSQRSPVNIGSFENVGTIMDYNFYNLYNPPSLTGLSSLSGSLAPSTPTDINLRQSDGFGAMTSPVGGSQNLFNFNSANFLDCIDERNQDLKPPDNFQSTPLDQSTYNSWQSFGDFNEKSSTYKAYDESQYLGLNGAFIDSPPTNESFPLDSKSQPTTPGFFPLYESNCTFGHTQPPHETESYSCKPVGEYVYNDATYRVDNSMNEIKSEKKIFQFSHTTPADFSDI